MRAEEFEEQLALVLREPNPKEAFYGLRGLYYLADDKQRQIIRDGWDFNRRWIFPDQSTLACRIVAERDCEERIRMSLVYHSIENCRLDWRDNMRDLCRIYLSAIRAGIDADSLFQEVAALSSPHTSKVMMMVMNRDDDGKRLDASLFREVHSSEGVRIEDRITEYVKQVKREGPPKRERRRWWKFW